MAIIFNIGQIWLHKPSQSKWEVLEVTSDKITIKCVSCPDNAIGIKVNTKIQLWIIEMHEWIEKGDMELEQPEPEDLSPFDQRFKDITEEYNDDPVSNLEKLFMITIKGLQGNDYDIPKIIEALLRVTSTMNWELQDNFIQMEKRINNMLNTSSPNPYQSNPQQSIPFIPADINNFPSPIKEIIQGLKQEGLSPFIIPLKPLSNGPTPETTAITTPFGIIEKGTRFLGLIRETSNASHKNAYEVTAINVDPKYFNDINLNLRDAKDKQGNEATVELKYRLINVGSLTRIEQAKLSDVEHFQKVTVAYLATQLELGYITIAK